MSGSVCSQHYHGTKPLAMVESSGPRSAASTGFFRVPNLFVRLSSKGLGNNGVDPDPVWSPTSPLDNLRSSPPRVGLGLVDALTAEAGSLLFGGKTSFLDSIRPFLERGLPNNKQAATACEKDAATADKIAGHADSEEYTCVIARGANPRTTHILGDETLEVRRGPSGGCGKVVFTVEPFTNRPSPAPAGVASGRCRCCMMRLPENRDIFIYK
jgi:hypothetical protein